MLYELAVENFLKVVKADCKAHGVRLRLVQKAHIPSEGNNVCNGYFQTSDDEKPLLVVSMKKAPELWLRTLVHEYSHMRQWVEDCPEWTDDAKYNGESQWHEWIAGNIELSPSMARKTCISAMRCEFDCEKRAAAFIRQYSLPLNVAHYIKQSNAYALFYLACLKRRKWYLAGREPYNLFDIVESMSAEFDMNYDRLTRAQLKLFDQCFVQPTQEQQ